MRRLTRKSRRKRQALAAVSIALVVFACWFGARNGGFYTLLAQHDNVCEFVRRLILLAGTGDVSDFDQRVYQAKTEQLDRVMRPSK
jgi:hypothetical protein